MLRSCSTAMSRWLGARYGTPEELPNIYHRKQYEAGLDRLPDYRLTCFFVDRNYRRTGVAAVALRGSLQLIAQAGSGVVEAYPPDTPGKKVSASSCTTAPEASSQGPDSATTGARA